MNKLFLAAALAIVVSGCSSTEEATPSNTIDEAIKASVNTIIIPSVNTLHDRGDAMGDKLAAFAATPTDANLTAAKAAWVDARAAWEITEGYGFGPEGDVDPNIDDWPLDTAALGFILRSNSTIDANAVASMETNTKGFHAIEFLLYGYDGNKTLAMFTPRELAMLAAMGADASTLVHDLATAWSTSGGNYGSNLLSPGGASDYGTRTDVLNELAAGLVDCSGEVAAEKIAKSIDSLDEKFDESRYSKNSINDFVNNITGVRNMYLGTTDGSSGKGLSAIIRAESSSLDDSVKAALTSAIGAINAITPSFVEAIHSSPATVRAAQAKVEALNAILDSRVRVILSTK